MNQSISRTLRENGVTLSGPSRRGPLTSLLAPLVASVLSVATVLTIPQSAWGVADEIWCEAYPCFPGCIETKCNLDLCPEAVCDEDCTAIYTPCSDKCPCDEEACPADSDGDGATDSCDNCPFEANSGQEDTDGDGIGDVCDMDVGMYLDSTYDELGRPVEIRRNGKELITYQYDGTEMTKRQIRTQYADLANSMIDSYIDYDPSYDQFGRITQIENLATHTGSQTETHTLAAFTYQYDAAGNRTSNNGSGFSSAKQVLYAYDRLHRLTTEDATSSGDRTYVYDLLGNREQASPYSYDTNAANEYTQIVHPVGGTSLYAYDARGNLSKDDGFDLMYPVASDAFHYAYDAENRLTKVDYDPGSQQLTAVALYRYDALGRRVEYVDFEHNVTTHYYYDGPNAIADCAYTRPGGIPTETLARTYVHGMQYIDERAVMRDHQVDPKANDNEVGKDYYYLLQELYTVAGLADCRGWLTEMNTYEAYGNCMIWRWPTADLDHDGQTTSADQNLVYLGIPAPPDPLLDTNLDGAVDSADFYYFPGIGEYVAQLYWSGVGNHYLFTGRTTDRVFAYDFCPTCPRSVQMRSFQDNRNRMYDPKHGRWLQRDPQRYVDGMNLYQYVKGSPTRYVDLFALASSQPASQPTSQPTMFSCAHGGHVLEQVPFPIADAKNAQTDLSYIGRGLGDLETGQNEDAGCTWKDIPVPDEKRPGKYKPKRVFMCGFLAMFKYRSDCCKSIIQWNTVVRTDYSGKRQVKLWDPTNVIEGWEIDYSRQLTVKQDTRLITVGFGSAEELARGPDTACQELTVNACCGAYDGQIVPPGKRFQQYYRGTGNNPPLGKISCCGKVETWRAKICANKWGWFEFNGFGKHLTSGGTPTSNPGPTSGAGPTSGGGQ